MLHESLPERDRLGRERLDLAFQRDTRPHKLALFTGTYVPEGRAPGPMEVVQEAWARLGAAPLPAPDRGLTGHPQFLSEASKLILGRPADAHTVFQTPGGTGALRLGCGLLRRAGGPGSPGQWMAHGSYTNTTFVVDRSAD